MKKKLRAAAFLLALALAPVFTASAHDNGRRHRHGRKRAKTTAVHANHRNPTPGTPRRVRRGRNTTPGVRRGAINTTTRATRKGAGAAAALEHGSGHGRTRARIRVRN